MGYNAKHNVTGGPIINDMETSREIELEGHIIDSGIMTKVFDKVLDMGGNFEVLSFEIGKKKQDVSYARLLISALDQAQLDEILSALHRLGYPKRSSV